MSTTSGKRGLSPKAWATVAVAIALVVMFAWLQGTFSGHRVGPADAPHDGVAALPAGARTVAVAALESVLTDAAPGTVRSRTEAALSPRIQAAVREVLVDPGDAVRAGQVLVRLDPRDVVAKLSQAQAALAAASAASDQARRDRDRIEQLFADKAATPQQLDQARAAASAAAAATERAGRAVDEARVFSAEAEVTAPFDGIVTERRVDPGALAAPGVPLVVVLDPSHLRIEASVREDAARRLAVGAVLQAQVDGVAGPLPVAVEEIVPATDPSTRTVLVKAALPEQSGARPGSFARLAIPTGAERVLVVPLAAIESVGQIETVQVADAHGVRAISVRTGARGLGRDGDMVEVLAGLHAGDQVVLPGKAP